MKLFRFTLPFLLTALPLCHVTPIRPAFASQSQNTRVSQWTRFETEFTSAGEYRNPLQDLEVRVEFTSPGGQKHAVLAFWDGNMTWKVRFSPEELGEWTYRTSSLGQEDPGLDNQTGSFTCVPYTGEDPLYAHGAIRVSDNRRYLTHADGTPFFWLADTAWNGALKSDPKSWGTYLKDRVDKGFSVIQFVMTQWVGAAGNADARAAFYGKERIAIDPVFFQWMDERVDLMNDHGLVAAPVLIWTVGRRDPAATLSPGILLPDDQIIILARYMVARYGAYQVIWTLGGDGDYRGEKAERWKKMGRAVFGDDPPRPATMHPGGRIWVADEFRNEPWFSFIGYQSSHSSNERTLRWITGGPPSQDWRTEPHYPIINMEPNYEAHNDHARQRPFDAHAVRRAAYWSLLVSPPAGITYGGHGIWSWELKPEVPMNHRGVGMAAPWYEAMKLPGATHMKYLRNLFASFEWWRLRPAQDLLVEQPGLKAPHQFVAVAKLEDGDWALAYLPVGGSVTLRTDWIGRPALARWFNPRTGSWSSESSVTEPTQTLTAPDDKDWVVWVGSKTQ